MKMNTTSRAIDITARRHWFRIVVFRVLFVTVACLAGSGSYAASGTWVLNPINNDWNMAANWSSNTVPGATDTATFALSNITEISVSSGGDVGGIVFGQGASAYSVTALPAQFLVFRGIVNNGSTASQRFVAAADAAGNGGALQFQLGSLVSGGPVLLMAEAPLVATGTSPVIFFIDTGSAGNSTIINQGGMVSGGNGGLTAIQQMATLATANVTNEAGTVSGAFGGTTAFDFGFCDAGSAVITSKGATVAGAGGGSTLFQFSADAANSTLIADGGTNGGGGGTIQFQGSSKGGTARLEVFGNGSMSTAGHNSTPVTVGSLEGDGQVFIPRSLTIGSNNLSTTFSGVIQDAAALSKIGSGTLTLSGANLYTGTSTVSAGALLASNTTGSATGTGAVAVNAGTLGGSGTISGVVTIGTGSGGGAFLAPAFGTNKQITLTLQSSLTLQADATYTYTFKARKNQARTDLVIANGVTINGATIALQGQTQGRVRPGTVLTVLSNTSANPISGTFGNLADGAIVNVNGNNFQASYHGGDGNDLTLTAVP
jgi:autotransporter-associated beta strand protein